MQHRVQHHPVLRARARKESLRYVVSLSLYNAGTPCMSRLEFVTHNLPDLAAAVLIMVAGQANPLDGAKRESLTYYSALST